MRKIFIGIGICLALFLILIFFISPKMAHMTKGAKGKALEVAARVTLEACYVLEEDHYNQYGKYTGIKGSFELYGYKFISSDLTKDTYTIKAIPSVSHKEEGIGNRTLMLNETGIIKLESGEILKKISDNNLSSAHFDIKAKIVEKF